MPVCGIFASGHEDLQRLIMSSSTWMQSALADEQRALLDRENTLLWRRSPMRLEAEAIRD
ncbi:MAG: DUF1553 domain-containing protein, partial [Planctomycetaceae bacterium]